MELIQDISSFISRETSIEPRDYQIRLIAKALDSYRNGGKSILLESPTGSGKSLMGLLICKFLEKSNPELSFGWVTMRRKLLLQAKRENERVGVNRISFVSMFDKNPPRFDLMVSDECLPGYVKVIALVDGEPKVITMGDIIQGNGTHVLSEDDEGYIFQPISSRVDMGEKEIWEVLLDNGQSLHITETGRVLVSGKFEKVSTLDVGLKARSCCQTYSEEGETTHVGSEVRPTPKGKEEEGTTLLVRVWPEGSVELACSLLSEVSFQSSPEKHQRRTSDKTTRTNNTRNNTRGWKHLLRKESERSGSGNCQTSDKTFHKTPVGLHQLALQRIGKPLFDRTQNVTKQGLWEGDCGVQHLFSPEHLPNRERDLQTGEKTNSGLYEPDRESRSSCLVHGRRGDFDVLDPFVFRERESSVDFLVREKVGDCIRIMRGQTEKTSVPSLQGGERLETTPIGVSLCPSKSLVQVQASSLKSVERRIVNVRKTKISIRTYDIGVENTHCFFANGIMVHNCQHDAAASSADLHKASGAGLSLGLTATPFRTDRVKLSFDKVISDCGVRFLIEAGFLSQFREWVIPKWTPQDVAKHYLLSPDRWGKSVVYMKTLPLCFETMRILQEGGVTAEVIHGAQSRQEQDDIYERFEDGVTKVLVNVYLLTEGFDAPDLQTVFVRDSGKLCTMQMSGRVLRKDPSNGKKVANIVQSEETWYPYTKVAKASEEYVWQDESWRSISASELMEKMSQIVRERILTLPIMLPSYLDSSRGHLVRVSNKGKVTIAKRRKRGTNQTTAALELLLQGGSPYDDLPDDLDDADLEEGA